MADEPVLNDDPEQSWPSEGRRIVLGIIGNGSIERGEYVWLEPDKNRGSCFRSALLWRFRDFTS